jgi:hypothetical protein
VFGQKIDYALRVLSKISTLFNFITSEIQPIDRFETIFHSRNMFETIFHSRNTIDHKWYLVMLDKFISFYHQVGFDIPFSIVCEWFTKCHMFCKLSYSTKSLREDAQFNEPMFEIVENNVLPSLLLLVMYYWFDEQLQEQIQESIGYICRYHALSERSSSFAPYFYNQVQNIWFNTQTGLEFVYMFLLQEAHIDCQQTEGNTDGCLNNRFHQFLWQKFQAQSQVVSDMLHLIASETNIPKDIVETCVYDYL